MNYEDAGALLDYHYWARHRLLDALAPLSPEHYTRDLGSSFKSIRDTAVHIYSYSRWRPGATWSARSAHFCTNSVPPGWIADSNTR
jgi:hypothetical protein